MTTRAEMDRHQKERDARALEDAARVVRRRMRKPAGVSTALFCRTLTEEAGAIRAELAKRGAQT